MGSCQVEDAAELWEKIGIRLQLNAERLGVPLRKGVSVSSQFEFLITDLASASPNGKMVLLVDEYDKPLLGHLGKSDVNEIRDVLKAFYSVIKTCEGLQRFALITGVSKFSKVSIFSDLNNLNEYSIDALVAQLFGYTHEEVRANFPESLQLSSVEHASLLDQMVAALKADDVNDMLDALSCFFANIPANITV